jgi:hypothetical protein
MAIWAVPAGYGQSPNRLQLLDASRFWIEGSSTVNTFSCHVDTVDGFGPLPTGSIRTAADRAADTTGLAIPVGRFDCDNDRMSRDLRETLQADAHPHIRFKLHDARVLSGPDTSNGWYRIEALGFLTVAGTERLVRTYAWGRPLDRGRYRVRGCKPIKMTYFNIDPPTKFLGAIKVHNEIEVHFDLVAQPADRSAPSSSPIALTDSPDCHE